MARPARTRGQGRSVVSACHAVSEPSVSPLPVARSLLAGLLCAVAAIAVAAPQANAAPCPRPLPQIQNKPGSIPHVDYAGVQHLTFCEAVNVRPGQNIIRLNGTRLFPQQPGYVTRFDPELVYPNGTVPRVDVIHLHHGVWVVNGSPQFAAGEEKTIIQAPKGFGWRSTPSDNWFLNDMLHDLVGTPATVYIVWRMDFVPDTATAADSIRRVSTRWLDVAGPQPRVGISSPIYPVFDALRSMGNNGRYTFPDQATVNQRRLKGPSQAWTPNQAVTLINTAGHLHPGGLQTSLRVDRNGAHRNVFTSKATYFEPAGAVSWDVSMGATPPDWRVKLRAGDRLSVHATYDVGRADWYEVMGIMPVAVYNGTNAGGKDAFGTEIPQRNVLTHGHLEENRSHGGDPMGLPDPRTLPGATAPDPIGIDDYQYAQGDMYAAGSGAYPPRVAEGQSLTFLNQDIQDTPPAEDVFHTITACKAPCNRSPGIAYPIANGPVTFDSGQLGFNDTPFGAPAVDRDTWETPTSLDPGTYSYFCRVHPFMRGSFRVTQ
jgi:plastocyanin